MKSETFAIISQISHDGKLAHSLLSHHLMCLVFVYNFADQLFFARSLCREISSNKPTTPPPSQNSETTNFHLEKKCKYCRQDWEGVTMSKFRPIFFNISRYSMQTKCFQISFSRGIRILKFQDHLRSSGSLVFTLKKKTSNF